MNELQLARPFIHQTLVLCLHPLVHPFFVCLNPQLFPKCMRVLAGCRTVSVLSLGVGVVGVNCFKVRQHWQRNCEARKCQFLLSELVDHREQMSAGGGDWQWF